MGKKDILELAHQKSTLSHRELREAFSAIVSAISETLLKQGRVSIPKFGVLKVKERAPRKGRNPKTGEIIQIPAKKAVVFRPAKALKEVLQ